MPADKRLIECPSCYATKGQYHKPGCPALTPPAGPATACLCGSPYADWTANGKLMCARCAANFVAASRFSADPAAVPLPEWALDEAHKYFHDQWGPLGIPTGVAVNVAPLAHLLASVREGETASKDRAYTERNRLVALIASLYPSSLERHDDADKSWEDDWRWIVFIDLPTGQASWHIHDSHLPMFDHVPRFAGRKWDGHTTEEKYARISLLHTPPSGGGGA